MLDLATIGSGNIVRKHLLNLDEMEDHDDVDVVAVCDVDQESASSLAADYDADVYTDHEALFDEVSFDTLLIGIPPFAHTNQELLAAEHGVDVLVEKPIALERDTAREIDAALDRAGVVSQVGHMWRYAEITDRADELLGDRTIGVVNGRWYGGVPGVDWWRDVERSGGQIVEQATHVYDIVRYFAGDVESVTAAGSRRINTDVLNFEDSTAALIEHESGTVSTVSASSVSPGDHGVTLVGDGFNLTLDFGENRLSGAVDDEPIDFEGTSDSVQLSAMASELDSFLTAVKDSDAPPMRSPYGDARKTFELTLAAQRSVDTGETIRLEDR